MKFLIPSLAVTGLLITSCATTESFVNDDVYSVKPSELPIGESTSDETSYASFKSRKLLRREMLKSFVWRLLEIQLFQRQQLVVQQLVLLASVEPPEQTVHPLL